MIFFVDRSLGRHQVPQALRDAGRDVVVHDDIFDPATPDEEWLDEVRKEQWVVLSKDAALRYSPEVDIILDLGLHVYVVTNAQLSGPAIADLIVAHIAAIEQRVQSIPGGYVVGVYLEAPNLRPLRP